MTTRPPNEGDNKDLQWKVLHALQRRHDARRTGDAPHKTLGLVLARACGIRPHSSDDSRKKGLRNVVRGLRQAGVDIVSDLQGYWLAADASDHAQYRDFLRRQGLARLATEARSKRSRGAAEDSGQLAMWEIAPTANSEAIAH